MAIKTISFKTGNKTGWLISNIVLETIRIRVSIKIELKETKSLFIDDMTVNIDISKNLTLLVELIREFIKQVY